jgi:hypothetical protein
MRLVTYVSALLFFAAGCRFGVRAVETSSPTAVDMAMPPVEPSDGSVAALADLAGAPDLAPPPDMASPCTTVTEDFMADAGTSWVLAGNAALDGKALQLTTTDNNVAGSAFYDRSFFTSGFDASFKFRINDGSGADGVAFVFAKAASAAALGVYGNGEMNTAWGLGYYGMNGYAIELDTFKNTGNGDPDGNHVGFMLTSNGTHVLTGSPTQSLRSSGVRSAHIRFTASHVHVDVDGAAVLDGDLPASVTFAPDNYWFGFTGASGGLTDHHQISGLTLVVGPDSCL